MSEETEERQAKRVADISDRLRQWEQRQNAIRRAGEMDLRPVLDAQDIKLASPTYPRWESGLESLDAVHDGFQGVSLIGGEYGTGKSTLALGSALLAAHSGTCVVYFDAENGKGSVQQRIAAWYADPVARSLRFEDVANINFHWAPVFAGHELKQIARLVMQLGNRWHNGALIVFDSLNACAELLYESKQNPGTMVNRLTRWMDQVVRTTEGHVRCLALSELNASGGIKYIQPLYAATVAITMQHSPEDGDDAVKIRLEKNRMGRARVDLGKYLRNWKSSRFERLQ